MRRGKLKVDVWGLDLNSDARSLGLAFGDDVWLWGAEGYRCWTMEEDNYIMCLVQVGTPESDYEISNGGFTIPNGMDIVDYESNKPYYIYREES